MVMSMAVLAAFAVFAGVRQDASSETYSPVVDDDDKGRFAASKSWKTSNSGESINGDDYLFASPSKKGAHALFKVAIPTDGEYEVFVRWPEVPGLNNRARVGVNSSYGIRWTEVDQRERGGEWVSVGRHEMRRGDEYSVRVSRDTKGEGNVAADAIKVVKISSYEEPAVAQTEGAAPSGETRATAAVSSPVVTRARSFLNRGITYKYGVCTPTQMSCSCLTKKTFARFGYNLSMDSQIQMRAGIPVSRANLQPGDLVIFDENLNGRLEPWDHVAIYSRPGYIVHASSYFNGVVESQMRYIRGYAGARRLV